MANNVSGGLGINTDVLEKMVTIATLEVDGVTALAKRSIDITGMVSGKSPVKPVRVSSKNGSLDITVFISVSEGKGANAIAEAVQENVKQRVQDMTGNAITSVNVVIADLVEKVEEKK